MNSKSSMQLRIAQRIESMHTLTTGIVYKAVFELRAAIASGNMELWLSVVVLNRY